eukprot:scaffold312498_cov33-Tisochrysis_lutea.AAC.4
MAQELQPLLTALDIVLATILRGYFEGQTAAIRLSVLQRTRHLHDPPLLTCALPPAPSRQA